MVDSKHFLSSTPQDMQRALLDENRVLEEDETVKKAKLLGLPYLNLHNFPLDLNVLALFAEGEARESKSLPVYRDIHTLSLATVDPSNPLLLEKKSSLQKKYTVTVYLISESSYKQAFGFYKKVLTPKSIAHDVITVDGDEATILENLEKFKTSNKGQSASEVLTVLFGAAIVLHASDIHIEPEADFIKVRFRLDGVLSDIVHLDKITQRAVMARLKSFSKLKLNVENLPQDGRLTFFYKGKPVDVRVSTLPSANGEGVVLRLLGTEAKQLKIADLGMRGLGLAVVEKALAKPNGMIITTGPTGSGKTTTLYAFLSELNQPGVKIITLEDPVEYKLQGISQTPIDHNVDFSFAKGLRAILRQDPDIVMVGEIRDQETAETAMQAALTGHIVLSTLHTNDASGAIPRLTTMGVKPFTIAPALTAIIAQRLVRMLCVSCRKEVEIEPATLTRVKSILEKIPKSAQVILPRKIQFFAANGCDACGGLGYKGRIGIYEVIEVTDSIEALILKEASALEIRAVAIGAGTVSMAQDGLLKALEGITDVEEVFRVAGD